MTQWSAQKARETYNIAQWSAGYFDVGEAGQLLALPRGPGGGARVDLRALLDELAAAGLSLPVLVRFLDILHHRLDTLCGAFAEAMARRGYTGGYTAVYPIKVNQQRCVVSEILKHGGERVGLEAGSKPELMAVLALSRRDGLVVCNGYKDREYVRLALIGMRLGHAVRLVLEKPSEVDLVIREARALGVRPRLGLRVRLSSIGAGKWQNTGGEKSKFGLSAQQTLAAVQALRAAGLLDCLELLHCHLGSQIANIRDIQKGLREAARYYAELRRLGAPVACVDVGGGLGVDYEGTASRSFCSMNYTVQEYANTVVQALWEVCAQEDLPQPHLVTESGRALTAHHAVLVTNVIDSEAAPAGRPPPPQGEEPLIVQDLRRALQALERRPPPPPVEVYHEAAYWLAEAQGMYAHGVLDLGEKALAEQLYFAVCRGLREHLDPRVRAHRAVLDELNEKLADKYFCNMSVFQSLPDVWAIDQIFPVVPLQRLDEAPTRRAVLADITCDSDGRMDHYVDGAGVESTLPLHPLRPGEPYALGIFLVGAYQEILGDMHNLFGDTNSVNVVLRPDGSHRLAQARHGDTAADLLRHVHFDPEELRVRFREKLARAGLDAEGRRAFLAELEAGLAGYTYLED